MSSWKEKIDALYENGKTPATADAIAALFAALKELGFTVTIKQEEG